MKPTVKAFICEYCWTQAEGPASCSTCLSAEPSRDSCMLATTGWEDAWASSRSEALRECFESAAWMPGNWLLRLASDDLVEKGMLQPLAAGPHFDEARQCPAYQITYAGRAFVEALADEGVPDDVSNWHGASIAVTAMLDDCLAIIRDTLVDVAHPGSEEGATEAERALLLMDQIRELFSRGRSMLAGRDPYGRSHPGAAPSTAELPGEEPGREGP